MLNEKIISLVLCIAMLISSSNIVLADEITEEAYHTVPVEFSDNIGNAETLQVMIKMIMSMQMQKNLGQGLDMKLECLKNMFLFIIGMRMKMYHMV